LTKISAGRSTNRRGISEEPCPVTWKSEWLPFVLWVLVLGLMLMVDVDFRIEIVKVLGTASWIWGFVFFVSCCFKHVCLPLGGKI